MEEAARDGIGIMVSIKGARKEWIEQVCREIHSDEAPVVLSCYNTSKQYVVSAHRSSVPKLLDILVRNHVGHVPLNVSGPFHSPLMQQAADKLSLILRQYTFQKWSVPVISNLTGRPYTSPLDIADSLLLQMTCPVMWEPSICFMGKQKVNLLIELGPGSVLRNMIRDIPVQIEAFSFDKEEDTARFRNEHMLIHKNENFMNRCLAIAVSTPNQNEAEEDYEAGVVQSVRKLKQMHAVFEQDGRVLAEEQKNTAYELVRCILLTKGLSEPDIAQNMNDLQLSL
ncbi:Malonyl CoA-acyl carrier protein transacylase [compost metagenome]